MMTIPSELIDFTHIANATCTACVQQVKPGTHPAPAEAVPVTPVSRGVKADGPGLILNDDDTARPTRAC
jgi:hypothetical protein